MPLICLAHCGFADIVIEECGIKIPVHTSRQIALDIALAVE
jgi:hypothetical protein